MPLHHKNNWKHICAIAISLNFGSFNEPKNNEGYIHFAEHLMFSGTKSIKRRRLKEYFDKIFIDIKATTSRQNVNLYCAFDSNDFDIAIKVLEELRGYNSSYSYKMRQDGLSLLPISKKPILGYFAKIKQLKYKNVTEIKHIWNNLLKLHKRNVIVLGNSLTKKQIAKVERLFSKNDKTNSLSTTWDITDTNIKHNKTSGAMWFGSNKAHLNFPLLN